MSLSSSAGPQMAPRTPTRSEDGQKAISTPTPAPKNSQKLNTPASRKPPKLGLPKSASKKLGSSHRPSESTIAPRQSETKRSEKEDDDSASPFGQKISMEDNDKNTGDEAGNENKSPEQADTQELEEANPNPIHDQNDNDDDFEVVNNRNSEDDGTRDEDADLSNKTEDGEQQMSQAQKSSHGTPSDDEDDDQGSNAAIAEQNDTMDVTSNDVVEQTQDASNTAEKAADDAQETSGSLDNDEKFSEETTNTRDDAQQAPYNNMEESKDKAIQNVDRAGKSKDAAREEKESGNIEDQKHEAEGVAKSSDDTIKNVAGDAANGREAAAKGAQVTARDTATDPEDKVDSGTEDITDDLDDVASLKGLKVQENGEILDAAGNAIGKLEEGDPADLEGYEIGDNGEILDEDGDVVGRASLFNKARKDGHEDARDPTEGLVDTAKSKVDEAADNDLPGLDVLRGLEVQENGEIKNSDGVVLGRITEGDPADLMGMTLNEDGEILDEDNDVIGRAETVQQDISKKAKADPPDLSVLDGLKVGKDGTIKNSQGEALGKISEGDIKDLVGRQLNADGEILDEDGDVIGRAEVVADAAKAPQEQADEKKSDTTKTPKLEDLEKQLEPNFDIIKGRKVNKKGKILDDEGDVLAKLIEGDPKDCAGKLPNDQGEIVDNKGKVVGKVEIVQGEAADQAMKDAHPELVNQIEDAQATAAKEKEENIGDEPAGDGASEASPADIQNVEGTTELLDLSFLEGYKVNKSGNVLNEDGDVIARLSSGSLDDVIGKKLNDKGEILDNGKVIGNVEPVQKNGDDAEEQEDGTLPPLSDLQGLRVNKSGKIVDDRGNVVGELIEGDAKRLWKMAATADEQGQFWDKGRIIGRAKTIAIEEETEGEFAGLEGLVVVKEGWVEDENGNKVGKLVEGDSKKLVGRAVDEDGDIVDKKGNVVGHAERYEEPDAEEPIPEDLSELRGLTCNKQGNVIGPDGVPIGRLVQGNPKELAGRKIDEMGQIWNDAGKVVGKCEMIPSDEREVKAEGPFAGLEGLVVAQNGFVQDEDGKTVGQLVEGDPKKLVGRSVDEDGEITDKYGNMKGRAIPYQEPEPEQEVEDFSSLAGKTVNKRGKIVDEHGTIFGEVVEGNAERLVGCKVDGEGQVWSNDGKVIGKARTISGGDDGRAEGPFSNFESTTVGKDGVVKDSAGEIVGRVVEGDAKRLVGRRVDDNGDIVDKNGNVIGKAERWEPEEKAREVNAMAGLRVNKEGEVRDKNGDVVGKLTDGNLLHCIGREINDNGYVVDQDGNKLGEVTLIENIKEEEEGEEEVEQGPTDEETKAAEEREVAKKIANIIFQTIDRMEPICKQIEDAVEKADRTPREELDEEALVNQVKPLIEEGGRILSECNGSIRGLDPDGHIAAQAKSRHASGEASPEENRVAEGLKELTGNIVKCIDNAKKKIADMPHAKKKLNPLWALLTEPLFQIIAAVGLLLSGVLGLVGKLLNGLGLGGLVNGLLGGLGINKILDGIGLGSITESLGLGGGKKKG